MHPRDCAVSRTDRDSRQRCHVWRRKPPKSNGDNCRAITGAVGSFPKRDSATSIDVTRMTVALAHFQIIGPTAMSRRAPALARDPGVCAREQTQTALVARNRASNRESRSRRGHLITGASPRHIVQRNWAPRFESSLR